MQRELFWDRAGWMAREYTRAIRGEVDGGRLAKAGGELGGENMKEKGERMDGADKERDKERDGGVKAAQGGHCWCWNHRLEVKSFENKSNLHHCSAELSDAFHLAPFKTFPPPQQPSKLTTPFPNSSQLSSGEKNQMLSRVSGRPALAIDSPSFWSLFFQIPCRFLPSNSPSSFCNHHTAAQISVNILSVLFPASFPPCVS